LCQFLREYLRHDSHEHGIIRIRVLHGDRGFHLVAVDFMGTPMNSAGRAIFQTYKADQALLILDELPHHKHGDL
jgi:hypothetical protein